MADLNELRQVNPHWEPSFNLKKGYGDPVKEIMSQQIKEEMNPSKYTENDLEQAKCSIAEKILKHFDDTLFEMVCEEMSKNYLFKADNYLTEAGYDVFEDEWFEFYHEHHGDILHQVRQSLAN